MESMSPEMRAQLQQMMDQLIGDDRLRIDLARLAANMDQLLPSKNMPGRYRFSGDEPLSMLEAMAMMERLQAMDDIEAADARRSDAARAWRISTAEQVRDALGPEAQAILEQLQQIDQDAGRSGLHPEERRPLGADAAGYPQDRPESAAGCLRPAEEGRLWPPSDGAPRHRRRAHRRDQALRLRRSVPAGYPEDHDELPSSAEGARTPVQLAPTDFEVYRTELTDPVGHRADAGHEPLDVPQQLLLPPPRK